MTDADTLSDECAPAANNGNHQFAPCSCCMALAQVRRPGAPAMPGISQPGQANGFLGGYGDEGHDHGNGNGNGNGKARI